MLPPDFHWRTVASRPDGKGGSVFCDGIQVLRLSQRINDGGWYANFDTQRADRASWTVLECISYERGVVGAELWVERLQVRLRAEIDRLGLLRTARRR